MYNKIQETRSLKITLRSLLLCLALSEHTVLHPMFLNKLIKNVSFKSLKGLLCYRFFLQNLMKNLQVKAYLERVMNFLLTLIPVYLKVLVLFSRGLTVVSLIHLLAKHSSLLYGLNYFMQKTFKDI